jgi:long-chain acyl-CoA synthetase
MTRELLPRTNLGKIRRQELAERYEKAKKDEKANKGDISGAKVELSGEDKAVLEEPVAKACWDWLQEKFPDAGLTFDKSPQLDLNIDSLEWLNLTLEMHERFGAELSEEAIARIDTVRDLLNEVVIASRSGDKNASLFEHPEKLIDDSQKKWLKPLNPVMMLIAFVLYWLNYFIMHVFFKISAEGADRIPKECSPRTMPAT